LHSVASSGADDLAGGLSDWVDSTVEKYGDMSSAMDSAVTQSLEEQESKLVNDLIDRFSSSADGTGSELGDAMGTVTEISEKLDGSLGEITENLEKIVDMIETIKPVLDLVEEMLG